MFFVPLLHKVKGFCSESIYSNSVSKLFSYKEWKPTQNNNRKMLKTYQLEVKIQEVQTFLCRKHNTFPLSLFRAIAIFLFSHSQLVNTIHLRTLWFSCPMNIFSSP